MVSKNQYRPALGIRTNDKYLINTYYVQKIEYTVRTPTNVGQWMILTVILYALL